MPASSMSAPRHSAGAKGKGASAEAAEFQAGWISADVGFAGPFSITGALQDKDFGVVDEPVGNGGGHRGGVKDGSPVGKRQIGGNQG